MKTEKRTVAAFFFDFKCIYFHAFTCAMHTTPFFAPFKSSSFHSFALSFFTHIDVYLCDKFSVRFFHTGKHTGEYCVAQIFCCCCCCWWCCCQDYFYYLSLFCSFHSICGVPNFTSFCSFPFNSLGASCKLSAASLPAMANTNGIGRKKNIKWLYFKLFQWFKLYGYQNIRLIRTSDNTFVYSFSRARVRAHARMFEYCIQVFHYFARDKSSYDTMFEWEAINLFGLASRNG